MKILLATNHMLIPGGTEIHTIVLAKAFMEIGHSIEIAALEIGMFAEHAPVFVQNLNDVDASRFDVIIANHWPVVDTIINQLSKANTSKPIIQTIHGRHALEKIYSDPWVKHVYISTEIRTECLCSDEPIIRYPIEVLPTYSNPYRPPYLLSLCQGEPANEILRDICQKEGIEFHGINKHNKWDYPLDEWFAKATMVAGIGRTIPEALMRGLPAIAMDARSYQGLLVDGLICTTSDYFHFSPNNWSGRTNKSKDINYVRNCVLAAMKRKVTYDTKTAVTAAHNPISIANQYLSLL